jgi:hypothetical protein
MKVNTMNKAVFGLIFLRINVFSMEKKNLAGQVSKIGSKTKLVYFINQTQGSMFWLIEVILPAKKLKKVGERRQKVGKPDFDTHG